jgi:hypothetical protein
MAGQEVTPPTPLTPIFYAQGDGLETALLNALAACELDELEALHAQVWPLLLAPYLKEFPEFLESLKSQTR